MNKIIGCQIVSNDGKNTFPPCFESNEVFEDLHVAEMWLATEKANPENGPFNWVMSPVFEGDIENPEFIVSI